MRQTTVMKMFLLMTFAISSVFCRLQCNSLAGIDRDKCNGFQNWNLGIDRVRPSGAVVHGQASTGGEGPVQGTVHGSHVFGGPHNGAQSVGGGLNYQNSNGLHGSVDATHNRGQGTSYSASVGGSTKVGPGTLQWLAVRPQYLDPATCKAKWERHTLYHYLEKKMELSSFHTSLEKPSSF